jgi:CheY-like chemotaxis protein
MNEDTILLVAEDEDGHFALIRRNLRRTGLENPIIRFTDGQQVLDFFHSRDSLSRNRYILLLDLRLPKISGLEILDFLKSHSELKKIPVIVLTTASTHQDIERCNQLGCALYIVKPVEYDAFVEAIQRIGTFLNAVEVPWVDANPDEKHNTTNG